jgi:putative endonuclease
MNKQPVVYILASQTRGTLYIGATSDIMRRIHQHREGAIPGFTADHGVKRLVHMEPYADMPSAIAREKQLKGWRRDWKIALIEDANETWRDLALDLGFEPLHPKRELTASRMDPESSSG